MNKNKRAKILSPLIVVPLSYIGAGSKVPAEVAIPIIKKAVSIWPHIKYIAFPFEALPES
jgi:hypothetical protein